MPRSCVQRCPAQPRARVVASATPPERLVWDHVGARVQGADRPGEFGSISEGSISEEDGKGGAGAGVPYSRQVASMFRSFVGLTW